MTSENKKSQKNKCVAQASCLKNQPKWVENTKFLKTKISLHLGVLG